ncbi:disease resistance protein RPP13-like [Panicum miliaceum]|uniref:Disease resistance protein RPP13-like n=1 Tax=Panicum miliaceum TaxID=4540 RepID=A0A3L6TI80_PANMI|nr:disease resistance protein RPP13-like [Panicum miliaceum]
MPTRSNKVRRLSLHSTDSKRAKEADLMNLSHVRSLTVFGSLEHLHLKSFKTGIVQVLDLEGCGGFNEKHVSVSDICKMTLLKYLSLRGTDVRKLPSNIGDLKYLETLDVRETKVRDLPPSVGQLERISNILGGDKETRAALKVPREIKGTAKTLHVLKLAIYKLQTSDQSLVSKKKSDQMLKDLISSIQYLSGYYLKTLVIDIESSDFLIMLDAMESPPIYLTALELSGRHCFPSPSVCKAKPDPETASILGTNKSNYRGEIFVPAGGVLKLKLLRIFIPLLPSLNFSAGAMPAVERLELRFKRLEGLHGMDNLKSIHDVILTVDGQAGGATKVQGEDAVVLTEGNDEKHWVIDTCLSLGKD